MAGQAWLREHKLAAWSIGATVIVGLLAAAATLVAAVISNSSTKIYVVDAPPSAPGRAPAAVGSGDPSPSQSPGDSVPVDYGYYPQRAGYACGSDRACTVAPAVVMDSAVDNPLVGDERPFLCGSLHGRPVENRLEVAPGDVVTLRIYVDNNADPAKLGDAATAQNVHVSLLIPTGVETWFNLVGFVRADNATPSSINDTALLVGSRRLKLTYVTGSARYLHVSGQRQVTEPLSDAIASEAGVGLGDIGPGTGNSGYITAQVRVGSA